MVRTVRCAGLESSDVRAAQRTVRTTLIEWWACRDMHPAKPVKSRLLRCLSFRPEISAHGRTRTRTGDVLNVVSLLLDYMSMKNGNPGGIRTRSYPIESRMSWPVRRQGHEMAERRGHAPHAARWRHDLVSTESRHAGPVGVPL